MFSGCEVLIMGVVSDTCCEHKHDFREIWLPIPINP